MRFPTRHSLAYLSRCKSACRRWLLLCALLCALLCSLLCLLILVGGAAVTGGRDVAADTGDRDIAADTSWRWPLPDEHTVLDDFAPPTSPWGPGHRGIDLAADPGQPVLAAGAGQVRYAGMLAGRGVVSIVHGESRTTYEPVTPSVREGETVEAGDRIGVVGDARHHCMTQACLHWGLLRGDNYIDPLSLLGRGPVRLLPVWEVPPPYGTALDGIPQGGRYATEYARIPGQPDGAPAAAGRPADRRSSADLGKNMP